MSEANMPLRFFRRVRLAPGLRVNLSKSGVSLSIGARGAWFTVGPRGPRGTVGGLGSGLFYTTTRRSAALWIIGAIALGAFVLHLLR
jgi:hypothetical protein